MMIIPPSPWTWGSSRDIQSPSYTTARRGQGFETKKEGNDRQIVSEKASLLLLLLLTQLVLWHSDEPVNEQRGEDVEDNVDPEKAKEGKSVVNPMRGVKCTTYPKLRHLSA